ncbi:mediator complex subunit MED14-domain-containing protein [Boeremia exigua]|uniref:mediator complex subunit MED14-domain-containing protein n=1 Tax=Boeremia exigua TaxID=749465 RepID=UPI001E8CE767|nr:mediator complex subunit MED14-domain-containing protein [Boeremia exigua]KAH6637812.1 mediator complex subunit MED14-domain-containing protein [Boeremia exigua]
MPGILMMNHSVNDTVRDGENKKRWSDGKLVNGIDGRSDTAAMNGNIGPATNGTPIAPTMDQHPEEEPSITHIGPDAYHPLSKLLARVGQECYNALEETLHKMSGMSLGQQANGAMTNGVVSQDNPEVNKRKKLLLLKFAQENRAKFIKLLVLTEWGQKSAVDIGKVIDLYAWAKEQAAHMDFADEQVNQIKILSAYARENNPDIRTALEVLSVGKASWIPTLDYIPPDPISPDKALKLLRTMNTSLSIRLNVHETLPRHLRNWRIQSGRATFVIENEMEFDVVSFVEDATDQWWFLDLRLLFASAPTIATGSKFWEQLQPQTDYVLQQKGLSGLFDFLHNFVLTHKLSVLRSQAVGLARSGSLKAEKVHRELVVQYWTDRPGKKNWIEFGTTSNKPKNGKTSWRGPPIPSLTARWFRQGKEVVDVDLGIDWKDLSMDTILKRVIALHTAQILQSTRQHFDPRLDVQSSLSGSEPTDCSLTATLGTQSNSVALSMEPVTGNYIVQPASALSARAEFAMNQGREPMQIAGILTSMLSQMLRDQIQRTAQQVGWQRITRQALRPDTVKAAVKSDVLEYAMYSPRGWTSKWALAALVNTAGESWWIFELGSNGISIDYAEQIVMDKHDGTSIAINRDTLTRMERVAMQLLSFRVTARELDREHKVFSLRHECGTSTNPTEVNHVVQGWALYLQTTDLLTTNSGERPWLEDGIAITCEGLKNDGRSVWHIASGRMVKTAAADMQKLMAASPQSSFKFTADGNFRILLATPFGSDILGELRARLRDVNRLRSFATTLQKREMRLTSSSLQKVQFQYGPSPHTAAVSFASESEVAIDIAPTNPHYRIHRLLTSIANDRNPCLPLLPYGDANGLDHFCTTLVLTRSLLTVLHELETATPGNIRNPAVHVHSVFKYRLTYENPLCTFDIRLQTKNDKVYWFIEDNFNHPPDIRATPERNARLRRLENLQEKLKELFRDRAPGWFGTRKGIVTELDATPDALRKLNDTVLSCKMDGPYKPPPPLEIPQPQPQPQQPNGNTPKMQRQPSQQHQHMQQPPQQRPQQFSPQMQRKPQPGQQPGARPMQNGQRPTPQQMQHLQQLQQQARAAQQQQQARQGKGDIIEID